jgi:hypothetical protein
MIIHPYEGVGSVHFRMNASQVEGALGTPRLVTKNRRKETVLYFDGLSITLSGYGVEEVELLPETRPSIKDIDIFSHENALSILCRMDGSPQVCYGTIVFLKLGISISGLHDANESQRSTTAFSKGRFDSLRNEMVDFIG